MATLANPSSTVCTVLSLQDDAKSLLSDEALRVIQALQAQLQQTSWQLREAEGAAERHIVAAESQNKQFEDACNRHQQTTFRLRRLEIEQEEEQQHRNMLSSRLQTAQEELMKARQRKKVDVCGQDFSRLRDELERVRMQLHEALEEGANLRTRIMDAEEQHRKKSQRSVASMGEADTKRMSQGHVRASRMSEAKQFSAKVVQDQKGKDSRMQAERLAQLGVLKKQLESEVLEVSKQNSSLEQRMDALRNRNRQLEAQQQKQQSADKELDEQLQAELQRHSQRLRVLSDIFKLPPDITDSSPQEAEVAESVITSTAASPTTSASTFTSSARMISSKGSLALVRSSGAFSEANSPTLSQVATQIIAERVGETTSPTSRATSGDVVACDSNDSNDITVTTAGGKATCKIGNEISLIAPVNSHLDAAISRTQSLINEVQGWCVTSDLPEDCNGA